MPQRLAQKAVNNFVKGLITEAGELTFPESASVAEDNCDLRRDGTRRRRLAVRKELSYALSGFTVDSTVVFTVGDWLNVGGVGGQEFLVVQSGSDIYFYNKATLPYSSAGLVDTIDLSIYEHTGSVGSSNVKCQFASINGMLVISSAAINAFTVEWDGVNVTTPAVIAFKTRDFDWQGDITTYSTTTTFAASSLERKYDALNAGWVGAGITSTPPSYNGQSLTHPWYSGKDVSGNFSQAEWDKVFAGSSLTGNGHYVLDFFSKVRSGLATEIEASRFKTITAFSGRVFYSGLDSANNGGTLLFSKLITGVNDFGFCYQVNDPTSEEISDLLDTDGGVINIPDAVNIKLLYPFQSSLYIFADNGIWQINGVDGVFRASQYSVRRVSRVGLLSAESFVATEGLPFWWSRFGIHTLTLDQVSGAASETNISLPTIQTLWDAISGPAKENVTSTYDAINKKIYWAYPSNSEATSTKLSSFLILDIPLQAFYPWTISDQAASTDSIIDMSFYSGFGGVDLVQNVVDSSGSNIIDSSGNNVVTTVTASISTGDPAIVLLIKDGATNKLTMGSFSGTDFLDWGTANYVSFAETGYDFGGDMILKKNAPFVVVYTRLTETGFTGDEIAGYEVVNPSSILLSTSYDFKDTFSQGQQAYRLKYPVVVDVDNLDNFSYPEDVVTTRLKVRGKGRSMRMRFESEQGKNFILIGYAVIVAGNSRF